MAAFVCPGHPLLDSTIDLILERHRDLLRRGAVLVDDRDSSLSPKMLFFIEHALQDAEVTRSGERRTVSKQMLYVEINGAGESHHVHYAPYLDYRQLSEREPSVEEILSRPECAWLQRGLEQQALDYAIEHVVPEHLAEVRNRKLRLLDKTEAAVKERLTKEISYWDHRAEDLKLQEQAAKSHSRLNSGEARKRADELQARLARRLDEIKRERQISPLPPNVLGGVLVVPAGLIAKMRGISLILDDKAEIDRLAVAARAREIIMQVERDLGFDPVDREDDKLGYDIESRMLSTGRLRFVEVKGRASGSETVTVTKNEILYSLNKPDDFILAIVEFGNDGKHKVHYVRQPFQREPDFGVTSVNYDFAELLRKATPPQ